MGGWVGGWLRRRRLECATVGLIWVGGWVGGWVTYPSISVGLEVEETEGLEGGDSVPRFGVGGRGDVGPVLEERTVEVLWER